MPLTGLHSIGKTQMVIDGTSRRTSTSSSRGDDQPRFPRRDFQVADGPPHDVAGTTAISSTYLEKILARFDRMDLRLEKLEASRVPKPDPPYFSDELDDEGYHSPRDAWAADDDVHRPFIHARRDRGGDNRRRRGAARALHWRDDHLPQQNVHRAPYRDRPEPRHSTCWDRPRDRYLGMEESEQQHYADFYSGSRRRWTCWDPPSRTSGCRVGEIRAPLLPEPPPQPVPEPELFYGPTHRGTSDTPASKHTTRPSFGPRGFLHVDSDVPSRFPPSAYIGQQREQPQTRNRHLHPTFQSHFTPAHPQHVLDQQPQPTHRRAAAPPAPAAAPSPPLHMDQQRSPSCGHPTTHLRQAEACLELPTTVKQPQLQRPPSCLRSPSLLSATKLVSCEEKYLGIEGDAKVLDQVDLRLKEKKLVDEDERAIEVDKIDEDDGLHDSSKIVAFNFDSYPLKISVKGVNADTWSLVSPSIQEKLHNRYKDELPDAREDTVNGLSIYSRIGVKMMGKLDNKPFHVTIMRKFADDVYIKYAIVGYWRLKQRSCPFDPGGDTSPKLLRSTLRTRWILTVGELIRASFP